ncbi:cytochrome c oxidase subunit 2 [Roseivirga pacifica]|uniref:Cytochrome c oxidase subunit 2 n=1 Tax=Roseivirga pacifica TaxID=1267423 RepID=A0A1I0RFV0_9BACT|nr:cytochrome c oxidase subunit II [Roseivirga pacifica]RKQ49539.1 cytochrome c oxidase subunit 2 [Roseivirga pacifica]SEW39658.1 cytochrome c oxidase subunit 2 [Roseivirga pacifica]
MFGFYIALAVFLVVAILLLIFRISRLINVVKGKGEETTRSTNNTNAILMIVFMVGFFGLSAWYSWAHFDAYDPPVASDHGVLTDKLFWRTMWITGIVFFITNVLLFVFAYKYRFDKNRKALFYPHNNKLEYLWTGVPAIVLTWLVISGWMAWDGIMSEAPEDAEQIEIMGYQFAWSLRYGGMDNQVGDYDYRLIDAVNNHGQDFSDRAGFDDFQYRDLVIPKGKPVLLKIRARDVLHSVYMPHMRLKMDAVPGMPTQFWFVANKTTAEMRVEEGNPDFNYELACTEICGEGHFSMKKTVTVLEPEEYEKWKAEQKAWLSKNPEYMSQVPDNLKELAVVTAGINE